MNHTYLKVIKQYIEIFMCFLMIFTKKYLKATKVFTSSHFSVDIPCLIPFPMSLSSWDLV